MALSHSPYTYHHLLTRSPFPKLEQYPPRCRSLHKPVCRNLSLACSGEQRREKAKSSRRTKSDKEVCNELREFMSVTGLPENRVPTLKELSEHGRQSLHWMAILWLYPGVYEIKFIVDGNWRTDSQREIVTSGNITNNVLRVD